MLLMTVPKRSTNIVTKKKSVFFTLIQFTLPYTQNQQDADSGAFQNTAPGATLHSKTCTSPLFGRYPPRIMIVRNKDACPGHFPDHVHMPGHSHLCLRHAAFLLSVLPTGVKKCAARPKCLCIATLFFS